MKNSNEIPALGRRRFLQGMSIGAASLMLPRLLRAQSATPGGSATSVGSALAQPGQTLVYVNLRGGMDGLTPLAPVGDGDYGLYRSVLAVTNGIPMPSTLLGNNYWVLTPAFQPLMGAFGNGDLALCPATGQLDANKSHFVAMDRMELGIPPSSEPNPGPIDTGFMARHFDGTTFSTTGAIRGFVSQNLATKSFLRADKTVSSANPDAFDFPGDDFMRGGLFAMNATQPDEVKDANDNSFAAVDYLNGITFSTGVNGYPTSGGQITTLGKRFRAAEDIILSGNGIPPEVIEIDYGGWDTHNNQGPNSGTMFGLMSELGQALGNFYDRLSTNVIQGTSTFGIKKVIVIVISEFGRRVAENTTNGTDHGKGGLVMALGHRVNGGRIYDENYHANWVAAQVTNPGITPLTAAADIEGDVTVLTDYRDVFSEAFTELMGLGTAQDVYFSGFMPAPLNLFT